LENYFNDARLEGCGEKILHLLQKFNVENVLLVIGVDRKETFGIISPEYYHIIIERAKDLLSTLYERVVENENPIVRDDVFLTSAPIEYKQDGKRQQILPAVQTINLTSIPPHQQKQKMGRPNHFLTVEQRQHKQEQTDKNLSGVHSYERQKLLYSVLKNNMRRNNDKLNSILSTMQDNDYQHLRFISLYDKTPKIGKVFKMLMILDDIKNLEDLAHSYDYRRRLPLLSTAHLSKEKCKRIVDLMRQDKSLTVKSIARENHIVASLLNYVSILVRNHELSEKMLDIQIKEKAQDKRGISYELHNSKTTFQIEEDKQETQLLAHNIEVLLEEETLGTDGSYKEVNGQIVKTRSHPSESFPVVDNRLGKGSPQGYSNLDTNVMKAPSYISKNSINDPVKGNSINITDEYVHDAGQKGSKRKESTDRRIPSHGNESSNREKSKLKEMIQERSPNGAYIQSRSSRKNSENSEKESPMSRSSKKMVNTHSDVEEDAEIDEEFKAMIPDNPEDIQRFLEEHPLENMPSHKLQYIAEKLESLREKGDV